MPHLQPSRPQRVSFQQKTFHLNACWLPECHNFQSGYLSFTILLVEVGKALWQPIGVYYIDRGLWPFYFWVITCTSCQFSNYRNHALVTETAKIPRKVANSTHSPPSKNGLLLRHECNNMTIYFVLTCTHIAPNPLILISIKFNRPTYGGLL